MTETISVRLDADLYADLRRLAYYHERTVAAELRVVVRAYVQAHAEELKRSRRSRGERPNDLA